MKKFYIAFTVLIVFGLLLSSCQDTTPEVTEVEETEVQETEVVVPVGPANKLEEILARGTLIVSSDPAYPPQSQLAEGGVRAENTKCASDQHTASELAGFDIDVSVAIAAKLGVEACFVTPDWTYITAGNWANRWDISVGSMTITPERMEKLYFTQPYYTTPAAFFVHTDNTSYAQPSDLTGKNIGGCTGCTYDMYLAGSLEIPGETINYVVADPQFKGYETDLLALQDLAIGDGLRLDAVLTAQPTGVGAINDGLALKQLGEPVYFEYLAAAIDIASTPDPVPFVQKITEIILELHADGTLLQLSQQYYGLDLTTAAGAFDWEILDQFK
ncbi:MAG: transporter substrate-binding domain-containing protein [Anaerolineales bacterium]|jgi:polar amino acid transport system substrate-binding protein|nr:transporter substrate-binding domain-containing protein [Anaerolineales bacterium]